MVTLLISMPIGGVVNSTIGAPIDDPEDRRIGVMTTLPDGERNSLRPDEMLTRRFPGNLLHCTGLVIILYFFDGADNVLNLSMAVSFVKK